jgi:heme exporter protein D
MIPDLGRYALEVSLAYVGSLAALAALIGWVWLRGRRVRARLAAVEARRDRRM